MTRSASVLALVAALTAGAVAPAFAAWVPVAQIPLDASRSTDIVDASRELPSRVDAISLRASNTDVVCRNIQGVFRSGVTEELFRGVLPAGHEDVIDLLPVHRDIARIDVHCRAADGGVGGLDLAADVPGGVVITPAPAP